MKEKQIEEMANELATLMLCDRNLMSVCEKFYNAGYRKQSEWISVEERLPEHEENVLVAVDYEHIRATGVYISSLLERRQGERWTHKGYTVTHWMSLPEAPKMKGGAE